MPCKACKERGKAWNGSDPKCAFDKDGIFTGVFNPDNWNCATMNALRDMCEDVVWNEDENAAILAGQESQHIALQWYKRRGCTEGAWMLNNGAISPLCITEAESIIESHKAWRSRQRPAGDSPKTR